MSICPICGVEVKPRAANKAFPFCSARCKSIDLGKWLSEDYRVPAEPADEADELRADEADDGPSVAPLAFPGGGKPDMRH
jgi:endogenous inhibitor of DNA gyrase (YacG/DUF329 family)